jgi:L-alanine-DL-glutamate epimerase-like enolase superfamily enzyme
MAARDEGLIEVFYMKRAASLWGHHIDADANGDIAVPQGAGLGYEPDRDVMEKYRVA